MSVHNYGWLVLLLPLAGAVLIGLTFKALPQRVHGIIGTAAIGLSFVFAVLMFLALQDRGEEERQLVSVAWDLVNTAGVDAQLAILIDPLSVMMCLVVTGVSTLIHLYSDRLHGRRPRLHALLRLPELLRLQHAAAGPGRRTSSC